MKKQGLNKTGFLIYYQTNREQPIMGKGAFILIRNKYSFLLKKRPQTVMLIRLAFCKMVTNLL